MTCMNSEKKRVVSILPALPILSVFCVMIACLAFASCGGNGRKGTGTAQGKAVDGQTARSQAVATIFPVYDFARRIGGDRFDVRMLLPPGVEAHGYEPKPSDMAAISNAKLFVYTGDLMEPWARNLAESAGNKNLRIVNASDGIVLAANQEGKDPHVWLDPLLAIDMVDTIAAGMSAADPDGAALFASNAAALKADLSALDKRIASTLEGAKHRTVIYGGHSTFGYFARRYKLEFISPYPNFSPDAEPSAQAMAALLTALKKSGTNTVFYGELVEPRVARVIADASGAKLELLHGVHNVSKAELESGANYLSIMEANLQKLASALGAE